MKKLLTSLITTLLIFPIGIISQLHAATTFVSDDANMFSQSTVSNINNISQSLYNKNKQEILVKTVTSLNGQNINTVATSFAQQNSLNGVLFYISKNDKSFAIKVTTTSRPYFTTADEQTAKQELSSSFSEGNFDSGITQAVNTANNDLSAFPARTLTSPNVNSNNTVQSQTSNTSISWFWIIVILLGVFALIAFLRSLGSRSYGGPGMVPPTGAGYGAPVMGGGGGGFLSGFLGGLGGSIIGNTIFDAFDRDNQQNIPQDGGQIVDMPPTDPGIIDNSPVDTGGWGDNSGGGDSGGW